MKLMREFLREFSKLLKHRQFGKKGNFSFCEKLEYTVQRDR